MAAYLTVELMPREIATAVVPEDGITDLARIGVRLGFSDSLKEIEPVWRALEANGIDSPGQSFDFIRVWTETFDIPRQNQAFVSVEIGGRPLMAMAFERKHRFGLHLLEPFAGQHVGVNAPLMDRERMKLLTDQDRRIIWENITKALEADVISLGRVVGADAAVLPKSVAIDSDCLYRADFSSWDECDSTQRSRTRRKHDRQQGQKLSAMGEVTYEEIDGSDDASEAMDILFSDRAARFAEQGINDPFASPRVRAFYRSVFADGMTLRGQMQVLRLDGHIIAARYNLVSGSRMFCLISSMSTDQALQPGSPGKQILVHIMQHIFGAGIRSFDMGAGFTDEKRHWCNTDMCLTQMLLPTSFRGTVFALMLSIRPRIKQALKRNKKLFAMLKSLRARLG